MADPMDRFIDQLAEDAPINGLLDEDDMGGFDLDELLDEDE